MTKPGQQSRSWQIPHGDGYDFQLAAFRNYADVGEGPMPIMDCLMVNRALVG